MKKENQPIAENEKILVKAQNKLVSAHFQYNQCQMDILFYLLSIAKDDEKEYSFPIENIKNLTGRDWNPDHIKDYTAQMMANVLTYEERDKKDEKWKHIVLFQEISYNKGIITISLNEKAIPLFKQTKEQFTYFELKYGLLLSSKYSKRLYWYLCQWRSAGKVHVFIDELRSMLDLEKTKNGKEKYTTGGEFKRMIEKTIEEINKITDIIVEAEWNKTVKTITSVTFYINSQNCLPEKQSDINYQESREKGETLQYFRSYGLTEEQCLQMYDRGCRKKDLAEIIKNINTSIKNKQLKQECVINMDAYFIESIQNKGFLPRKNCKRPEKTADADKPRLNAIKMIKSGLAEGYPISIFAATMEKYGIKEEDL